MTVLPDIDTCQVCYHRSQPDIFGLDEMSEYVLREFVCDVCKHTIVVNPKLPADVTPKWCTPCYDKYIAPKRRREFAELMTNMKRFTDALVGGDDAAIKNLLEDMKRKRPDLVAKVEETLASKGEPT